VAELFRSDGVLFASSVTERFPLGHGSFYVGAYNVCIEHEVCMYIQLPLNT
jgi:hypothetical protein